MVSFSLTTLLIVVMVGMSLYASNRPELQFKLLMNPYRVKTHHEYYRFLSSGFVHGGFMHLFFNCFALYFFGSNVEYIFQQLFPFWHHALFIALFVLGVIVSDIPTFLKYKNQPGYNSLGASGGVSSVIFSSILFMPTADICLYGILCLPGFILGAIYLVYSYYSAKTSSDNINHDAHFYGAVFGLVFTILIKPRVVFSFVEQIRNWEGFW